MKNNQDFPASHVKQRQPFITTNLIFSISALGLCTFVPQFSACQSSDVLLEDNHQQIRMLTIFILQFSIFNFSITSKSGY